MGCRGRPFVSGCGGDAVEGDGPVHLFDTTRLRALAAADSAFRRWQPTLPPGRSIALTPAAGRE